jgi:hypothetical protein
VVVIGRGLELDPSITKLSLLTVQVADHRVQCGGLQRCDRFVHEQGVAVGEHRVHRVWRWPALAPVNPHSGSISRLAAWK